MEGTTELRVIPYLMEANGIAWGPRGDPVVHIAPNNGAESRAFVDWFRRLFGV